MYKENKEKVRNEAIMFQASISENQYFWSDIVEACAKFTRLGKRYGLLKEFRENSII